MEDLRLKKLEINVSTLNRRITDHDELHAKDAIWKEEAVNRIGNIERTVKLDAEAMEAIHDLRDYARKTYEVVQPLAKVVGYGIKIGACGIFVWHGIKLIAAKALALNL